MFNLGTPSKPRDAHLRSQSTLFSPAPGNPVAPTNPVSSHDSAYQSPQAPSLTHPPTPTSQAAHELPPITTNNIQPARPSRTTNKLADWFTGESDPIAFNLVPSPTKERLDPVREMAIPMSNQNSTCEEKAAASSTPKPPIISRFSLFGSKPPVSKAPQALTDIEDEWLKLDVKIALSPSRPADPFSPASFKNLQQNAEGLLSKFQGAYKERSLALHNAIVEKDDAIEEKETQAEELEGARMRTRHLKLQLDDMTAKLAEQDKAMMDLVDQLAHEKQARREAEYARREACNTRQSHFTRSPTVLFQGKPQEICVPEPPHDENQLWKSRTSTASEMSLESLDSSEDSLFDRRGATSPTMSMSSVSTMNSPEIQHQQLPSPSDRYGPSNIRSSTKTADTGLRITTSSAGGYTRPTPNNHKDTEAWTLVEMLKLENSGLKTRLSLLDNTIEYCLDIVEGLT
ncbi:MAG: hypothetical protein Q9218_007381 [Villophora microphyllina]